MNDRSWRILGASGVLHAALLAGCTDASRERLEGAQRALAALPDVEVVSTDAAAGVLTVRSRSSGEVTAIDLGAKSSRTSASSGAVARTAADRGPPTDTMPAATGASAADAPDSQTALARPGEAAAPVAGAPDLPAADAEPGSVATANTVAAATAAAPIVVRDPQGRVQVIEGSGFRIERAPAARAAGAARIRAAAGTAGAGSGVATAGSEGALRRLSVPVVCGAGETRSLQGVLVDVPGAGIVAERGCTLTIANVHVRSGGWGLVVNPGASVRIDDSMVEGRTGALDLHPGASLSAWATTFRGALGRPAEPPQFVDRGGNAWQ